MGREPCVQAAQFRRRLAIWSGHQRKSPGQGICCVVGIAKNSTGKCATAQKFGDASMHRLKPIAGAGEKRRIKHAAEGCRIHAEVRRNHDGTLVIDRRHAGRTPKSARARRQEHEGRAIGGGEDLLGRGSIAIGLALVIVLVREPIGCCVEQFVSRARPALILAHRLVQEPEAERVLEQRASAAPSGFCDETQRIIFAERIEHAERFILVERKYLRNNDTSFAGGSSDGAQVRLLAPVFGTADQPPAARRHFRHPHGQELNLVGGAAVHPVFVEAVKIERRSTGRHRVIDEPADAHRKHALGVCLCGQHRRFTDARFAEQNDERMMSDIAHSLDGASSVRFLVEDPDPAIETLRALSRGNLVFRRTSEQPARGRGEMIARAFHPVLRRRP
ncbi:MAG: hypothetical protein ABIS51_16720 [Sphingomonas sp.]